MLMELPSGEHDQHDPASPIHEKKPDLEVEFARDYLDTTAGKGYYDAINLGTPESFALAKSKLLPLKHFLPNPNRVLSVGVGAGEELHAAAEVFTSPKTKILGLDLSPRAISLAQERLIRYGSQVQMVEGSAISIPFANHSIDGIIESAILHEIYSYVPDGKEAWKAAVSEVAMKLAENGVYLLRDFSAPSYTGEIRMTLSSDMMVKFYEYFRRNYRVFASWDKEEIESILDRRNENDNDFPPVDEQSKTVTLPFARASEVILHYRNFIDNYTKGTTTLGDTHWKEINEAYLPPNPQSTGTLGMPRDEYVATVLLQANTALAGTEYEIICVQNESSL